MVNTCSSYRHRTALFVERKVPRVDLAHDDVSDESMPPDEAVAEDVGHEQLHRPLVRADAADSGRVSAMTGLLLDRPISFRWPFGRS